MRHSTSAALLGHTATPNPECSYVPRKLDHEYLFQRRIEEMHALDPRSVGGSNNVRLRRVLPFVKSMVTKSKKTMSEIPFISTIVPPLLVLALLPVALSKLEPN